MGTESEEANVEQQVFEAEPSPSEFKITPEVSVNALNAIRKIISSQVETELAEKIKDVPKSLIENISAGKPFYDSGKTETLLYLLHAVDLAIDAMTVKHDVWNLTENEIPDVGRFFETKSIENNIEKIAFGIRIQTFFVGEPHWYNVAKEGGKLKIISKMHDRPKSWRYVDSD